MARITTTLIIRGSNLLLFCLGIMFPFAAYTEGSPHWSKTGCQACHVEPAPAEGVANLQATDTEALCNSCHDGRGDAKGCRHMSGILAGERKVSEQLASSLKDGQVVCSTCHDAVYQCKHARIEYSYQNPGFLRNRTTRHTGEYCLNCHDPSAYEKLNPHEGVAGDPPRATCPLCHVGIPESDDAGGINVSFNMRHDLNEMCRGCHVVGPHPRNLFSQNASADWEHLAVASQEVASNMREAETRQGISLPLHPETGEIICATCHEPHGFRAGSVLERPEHRLRANDICQVCHDK